MAEGTVEACASTVAELQQRLARLRDNEPGAPEQAADELAAIERALHQRDAPVAAHSSQPDGADLLRQLAEVRRWRQVCQQHQLDAATDRAKALADTLLDQAEQQWQRQALESLDQLEPDACFQRLLQTTQLQLEAARSGSAVDRTGFDALKHRLRAALQQGLQRDREHADRGDWVRQLSDQTDQVLGELEDLAPDPAAAQLSVAIDDVQWQLDHVETEETEGHGRRRRRLKRKLGRLRAEREERVLQDRLEHRFGERFVALSEKVILALIVLVLGLMTLEWTFAWSRTTILAFRIIDTLACACFLIEFGVKLYYAEGRGHWFCRHFLIDLIPSLPVGLLTLGLAAPSGGDAVRFGRAARFLRLPRLVRYVRLLRPVMRLFRGFGLLARGLDRLVPRYTALLNRNIILYPTREELNHALQQAGDGPAPARLRIAVRQHWRELMQRVAPTQREAISERRLAVLEKTAEGASLKSGLDDGGPAPAGDELPAGPLLQRLGALETADVETSLDEPLIEQLSRAIRVLSAPPMRWLPGGASFAPRLSEEMSEAEVVAAAGRRAARTLKRWHDAWFILADVYGMVTPSQFVDRIGTTLVNSSFRPAYRLVLFGGGLMLVQLGLMLTAIQLLEPLQHFLSGFIGPTILVLGSLSVAVLAVGWWLKHLAREATEFYERSAEAKFVALTEIIRTRHLERDARILHDRVLSLSDEPAAETAVASADLDPAGAKTNEAGVLPIRIQWSDEIHAPRTASLTASPQSPGMTHFVERLRESLIGDHIASTDEVASDQGEQLVLLCRDWFDGAMFTFSDTRTTSQLLGNPAITELVAQSQRIDRKHQSRLKRLDLKRQGTLLGIGPYLWFNFVCRACMHASAVLLVDYNRYAIPLKALNRYSPAQRRRYEAWLRRDETAVADQLDAAEPAETMAAYVSTGFTALHFLDCDPVRDEKVKQHFGEAVLQRLQADRRVMIRRIFGTYPRHDQPKEQRVVNLYTIYQSYLARGRALLLPLYGVGLALKGVGSFSKWVWRSVREIRQPAKRASRLDAAQGDFRSAVRKINRVRLPVVIETLRLRMSIDPVYLGRPLFNADQRADLPVGVDADLRLLDAGVELSREVERQQHRCEADMARLRGLVRDGLLEQAAEAVDRPRDAFQDVTSRRVAAMVYLADYAGVRRRLSAEAILREVRQIAAAEPLRPRKTRHRLRPRLRRRFKQYWRANSDTDGDWRDRDYEAAWRAVADNVWDAADALNIRHQLGDRAWADGVQRIGQLLQHTEQLHEQVTTLRAVQTLSVLDVLHYREHVYRLGQYEENQSLACELLHWDATSRGRQAQSE